MKRKPPIFSPFLVAPCLVLVLLLCSSSCGALQYAPQYHLFSPGHWIGPPSAPVRTSGDGRIDLYAEFNEDSARGESSHASQQWYHVASLNYTVWFRDSPDPSPFLLPSTYWYNQQGSFAGSATETPSGDVAILYSCVGRYSVSRICAAQPFDYRLSFSSNGGLSQSVLNPLVDGDSLDPILDSAVRDPTRWWQWQQDQALPADFTPAMTTATAASDEMQPQWFFGVASENVSTTPSTAAVALFTSNDPRVLDNVRYAGVLYHDGNFTRFGTPELLIILEEGQSITPQRFLKLTMVNAERDYVVYGKLESGASFIEDSDRPPTFLDAGLFVAARGFFDPITRTERVVGYLPEDWAHGDDEGAVRGGNQGWAGALSCVRVVGYSDVEKRLTLSPLPELKALRHTKVFGSLNNTIVLNSSEQGERADNLVLKPLNLISDATPYHEIVVRFEIPDNWMVPSLDVNDKSFEAPEFGLVIRATNDYSAYTMVSLKMPTQASCEASGAVGDGVRFRSIPLFDEFNDHNVNLCNQTCVKNTICERWDAVLRPYGMDCNMYTLASARRSGEVCGTQSGCPLTTPYLVLNRTISGSTGNTSTLRGRAALSHSNPSTVEFHVLVDGSVIEVFKDGGLESLSGRVYVPENQNGIAVFARNMRDGMMIKAHATVYTMGSMWAPNGANLLGNERQEKVRQFTDSYAELLKAEDLYY